MARRARPPCTRAAARPSTRRSASRARDARSVRRRLGLARAGARRGSAAADRGDRRRQPQRDRAQQLARHPVRPLDQPLSRLRARLHLLLRAADATPISGCRPGSTSRPSCSPSTTRRRCSSASWPQPGYRCQPIALGTNTDPYQPLERRLRDHPRRPRGAGALPASAHDRHQVGGGGARPRPAGADGGGRPGAGRDLGDHARCRSSRASSSRAPRRRIAACRRSAQLSAAGVPTARHGGADHPGPDRPRDRGGSWRRPRRAGARQAGYVLLRLPHEVKELFAGWLDAHAPLRAEHVLSLVRQCRGGRLNDPAFGRRMRGEGAYAAADRQAVRGRAAQARPRARRRPRRCAPICSSRPRRTSGSCACSEPQIAASRRASAAAERKFGPASKQPRIRPCAQRPNRG